MSRAGREGGRLQGCTAPRVSEGHLGWCKTVVADGASAEPLLPCPGPGALVCEPQPPDNASWGAVQSAIASGECCWRPPCLEVGIGVQPEVCGQGQTQAGLAPLPIPMSGPGACP